MINTWREFWHQHSLAETISSNSIVNLSYLGLLKITGPDAKKFLQGQLTCNLDEITATQTRLGAHCNPKGRIISLFQIFYWQESYFLQMPRELIPIAMQALKKYIVFFKATIADASDDLICIGYYTEQSDQHTLSLPNNINEAMAADDLLIINIPGSVARYKISGKSDRIITLCKTLNPAFISTNHWQHSDIEANLVNIYPETSEKFLPHEINLHLNQGVSFNKGCYTGQEIIARMHYRGKLKTELRHIEIESANPPTRGEDLATTNDCIVDFCRINNNKYQLLTLSSIG
jgi:folate-binding protein YgfZ